MPVRQNGKKYDTLYTFVHRSKETTFQFKRESTYPLEKKNNFKLFSILLRFEIVFVGIDVSIWLYYNFLNIYLDILEKSLNFPSLSVSLRAKTIADSV